MSLGLLSAWEVQLKHMMGGAADTEDGSPKAAGQPFDGNVRAGSLPKVMSPQKSEHGSTLGEAAAKPSLDEAGGGFGDLWTTFLRTDV